MGRHLKSSLARRGPSMTMSCLKVHLFLVFGLVSSVISSPHDLPMDRGSGEHVVCYWSGTAPFCEGKCHSPSEWQVGANSANGVGKKCWSGWKKKCCYKVEPQKHSVYGNSDETLTKNVNLKYFNKNNRDLGTKWDKGGQTISFSGSQLTIQEEKNFLPDMKTTFIAHGFTSKASIKEMCEQWVLNYGDNVQVVCIDWRNLAHLGFGHDMVHCGGEYNCEAKNSVDVGIWLGRLLHSLVYWTGLHVDKVHLIGHSLGAHVVGNMGRTFRSLSGKQVARVTGLDPAGPLFVQNNYGLHNYEIGRDSGAFVDIIHSNGDLNPHAISITHPTTSAHFGDLHALGDVDFYPNGGRNQGASGCPIRFGICSHGRSYIYYLDSILQAKSAFSSYPCTSPETCSKGMKTSGTPNQMGEHAIKPEGEAQKLYYLRVTKKY